MQTVFFFAANNDVDRGLAQNDRKIASERRPHRHRRWRPWLASGMQFANDSAALHKHTHSDFNWKIKNHRFLRPSHPIFVCRIRVDGVSRAPRWDATTCNTRKTTMTMSNINFRSFCVHKMMQIRFCTRLQNAVVEVLYCNIVCCFFFSMQCRYSRGYRQFHFLGYAKVSSTMQLCTCTLTMRPSNGLFP